MKRIKIPKNVKHSSQCASCLRLFLDKDVFCTKCSLVSVTLKDERTCLVCDKLFNPGIKNNFTCSLCFKTNSKKHSFRRD